MSKAEDKTIELMKKAKDFIPDGRYSEKVLNLAFFMFIKGYHQAEKDLELTWEDISIIRQIMFDYNRTIRNEMTIPNDEEYCQEVLKRFKTYKEE